MKKKIDCIGSKLINASGILIGYLLIFIIFIKQLRYQLVSIFVNEYLVVKMKL